MKDFLAALWEGFRLALFARPRSPMPATPLLLAGLVLTGVATRFAFDFALVGPDGEFALHALPGQTFQVLLVLLAAALLARFAGKPERTLALALAIVALGVVVSLFDLAGDYARQNSALAQRWNLIQYYGVPLWFAGAAAVAALRLLELRGARRLYAPATTLLVLALPLTSIYTGDSLWQGAVDESDWRTRAAAIAREDVMYQQPKLLEQALAGLRPGTPGRASLYFVGMGGDASQDVFLREVRAVEKLAVERFGAAGRTVELINNPRTVMDTPIASATGLRRALKRIGQVMNREEDIVFLFLTSHGAKDHRFEFEFWPLQFNELTPAMVRQALDEAGIKWRVIVVSACYSGGFIEPLRNDASIVITAAAPDRPSFGCTHEAEWTYFGKAFFAEALRDTPLLTDAFERARTAVDARERKEGIEQRSDPRIAVGAAMQRKWSEYVRDLEMAADPFNVESASASPHTWDIRGNDVHQRP